MDSRQWGWWGQKKKTFVAAANGPTLPIENTQIFSLILSFLQAGDGSPGEGLWGWVSCDLLEITKIILIRFIGFSDSTISSSPLAGIRIQMLQSYNTCNALYEY